MAYTVLESAIWEPVIIIIIIIIVKSRVKTLCNDNLS